MFQGDRASAQHRRAGHSMKPAQMEALEAAVSEKICAHVPVTVQVRSGGLLDNAGGPIRIIDIKGVDANVLWDQPHLQVIKLLATDEGKKNKIILLFLVGNQVLKYAEKSYSRERSLVSLLKKEVDNKFMSIIANEIGTEETLVFLTVGEEKRPGGSCCVLEMLQGKGVGKN
ncbi:hypothetical protein J4Q44_G00280530 [Coregonus suidteri]|uniref:Uncharacterized protein n=1 Tax=Coregonus suidteri TaxID=861788 RepID=A0AAN8QEW7_9TELE